MNKQDIFKIIDDSCEVSKKTAFKIFDHPEWDGNEVYASDLLTSILTDMNFEVERGIADLPTAFRATKKFGEGGPNIGFIGEYDALRDFKHACGHHMQTPAIISAVDALIPYITENNINCTLTVYGTPAEETFGGKIIMMEKGCFKELDIALASHATQDTASISGPSYGLFTFKVEVIGKSSHAASYPHIGRSALDTLILAFNGIEFMREHTKDNVRMHYSIDEGTGPTNAVHPKAKATICVRSRESSALPDLEKRLRNILKGACLMCETKIKIKKNPVYLCQMPNEVLRQLSYNNFELLDIEKINREVIPAGGSTDFGNVSTVVPSILVKLPFCTAPTHSKEWIKAGKTDAAVKCMQDSAKTLAGIAFDLLSNPSLVDEAKKSFIEQSKYN